MNQIAIICSIKKGIKKKERKRNEIYKNKGITCNIFTSFIFVAILFIKGYTMKANCCPSLLNRPYFDLLEKKGRPYNIK